MMESIKTAMEKFLILSESELTSGDIRFLKYKQVQKFPSNLIDDESGFII